MYTLPPSSLPPSHLHQPMYTQQEGCECISSPRPLPTSLPHVEVTGGPLQNHSGLQTLSLPRRHSQIHVILPYLSPNLRLFHRNLFFSLSLFPNFCLSPNLGPNFCLLLCHSKLLSFPSQSFLFSQTFVFPPISLQTYSLSHSIVSYLGPNFHLSLYMYIAVQTFVPSFLHLCGLLLCRFRLYASSPDINTEGTYASIQYCTMYVSHYIVLYTCCAISCCMHCHVVSWCRFQECRMCKDIVFVWHHLPLPPLPPHHHPP